MKILRSRIFWGAIALALAAGLAFVGLPYINGQTRETVTVARVKEPVAAQTLLTEDMIELVEIGSYGIPDDVFTSAKSVAGLYAAVDLLPSDNLVPEKFTKTLEIKDASFYELPASAELIVSVPVSSLAASVSGKLQEDDIVAVYAVTKNADTDAFEVARYNDVLYMRVAAVTNSTATDTSEVDTSDSTASKSDAIPVTVSLYATDFQARRLIEIQAAGSVYFALVGRGADALALYESFTPADPYVVAVETPEPDVTDDTEGTDEPVETPAEPNE